MPKLLNELLRVSRVDDSNQDDDSTQQNIDQDGFADFDDIAPTEGDDDNDAVPEDTNDDSEFDDLLPQDDQSQNIDAPQDDSDSVEGNDSGGKPENPNRAGVIRHVAGAHLVYKRETGDGTYEEMWIYNSGDFKKDLTTKKDIVSGTDIPATSTTSPDGSQQLTMWSAGNATVIKITGLPQ